MANSNLSKIVARVNWIIGSRGSSFNDTVADDRFTQEEIRRAVVETEAEIVRTICEAGHTMRTQFLDWTAELVSGDPLPAHLGPVEAIEIKATAASDFLPAEATTRENIRAWRENFGNIFDTVAHNQPGSALAGYFNLTNDVLTYTGYSARALLAMYVPDYSTPALQIVDQFDSYLVAGAIPKLNKLGVPQALVATYGQIYMTAIGQLQSGRMVSPELPAEQKNE